MICIRANSFPPTDATLLRADGVGRDFSPQEGIVAILHSEAESSNSDSVPTSIVLPTECTVEKFRELEQIISQAWRTAAERMLERRA